MSLDKALDQQTLDIPNPRLLTDENAAEKWARQRVKREEGAGSTDRRRARLQMLESACGIIEDFMALLASGVDPWLCAESGWVIVAARDDKEVSLLVAEGLKRRGFTVLDLRDQHMLYHKHDEKVPPGIARWAVIVADPILSLKP